LPSKNVNKAIYLISAKLNIIGRGSNNLLYGQPPVTDYSGRFHAVQDVFSPLLYSSVQSLEKDPDYRMVYSFDQYPKVLFADYSLGDGLSSRYSGTIDFLLKTDHVPEFTYPENKRFLTFGNLELLNDNDFATLHQDILSLEEGLQINNINSFSEIDIKGIKAHPSQGQELAIIPTEPNKLSMEGYAVGDSLYTTLGQMMVIEKQFGNNGQWLYKAGNRGLFYKQGVELLARINVRTTL
jgi:hypothetical protein